jgi:hypothetical protein
MAMKFNIKFDNDDDCAIINGRRTTHDYSSNGRSVYIGEKYVLKVNDRGYTHIDLEVWERIEPRDRKYFVPTLAEGVTEEGNIWSIQPYVELDWHVTNQARKIVDRLVRKYELYDIDDDDIHDDPRNWAMHNGQPIIFDYGF